MSQEQKPYQIIIIGQANSGKTALIKQILGRSLSDDYRPTVYADMFTTQIVTDEENETLTIWELPGSEPFNANNALHFKNKDAAVICVALDKPFDKNYLNEQITTLKEKNLFIAITLVGTKSDLDPHEDTENQLRKFAQKGSYDFIAISAKDNINVNQLVSHVVDTIKEKIDAHPVEQDSQSNVQPAKQWTLDDLNQAISKFEYGDNPTNFKIALEQLAAQLAQKSLRDTKATNATINATMTLLDTIKHLKPSEDDDTKTSPIKDAFQNYLTACPHTHYQSSFLSKLIKTVVITGILALAGAALGAGICLSLGLGVGIGIGIAASIAGTAGLLTGSIAFFKKHPIEKAIHSVVDNGKQLLAQNTLSQSDDELAPLVTNP